MTNLQKTNIEKQISEIKSESVRLRIRFILNRFDQRFKRSDIKRQFIHKLMNVISSIKRKPEKEAVLCIDKWFIGYCLEGLFNRDVIKEYIEL
jgi:hypothetical protein